MLPPHRPFRDKPKRSSVIKKKVATVQRGSKADEGIIAERPPVKGNLLVLGRKAEQAGI